METIRKRLQQIFLSVDSKNSETAEKILSKQKSDGSWNDINYDYQGVGAWDVYLHLSRAFVMAQAFRDKNSRFYLDSRMSTAIRAAVQWWVARNLYNPNWWWNEIGVPRTIGTIVLLLGDAMPTKEQKAAMPIIKRYVTQRTGQNLLWALGQQVIYASLEKSDSDMADASKQIACLLVVQPLGKEGIQSDGSFHQHNQTLYSGGYGKTFISDCGLLIYALNNTRFSLPPAKIKIFEILLLDGIQWMSRGSTFDYGTVGRNISRQEPHAIAQRLGPPGSLPGLNVYDVFRLMCDISSEHKKEFKAATKRYAKIMSGGVAGVGGIKYFEKSDFLIQNEKDFYLSVRMHSKRIYNTDYPCGGGEGLKSHFIADGCTFIMRSGLEYYRIFPCWDWRKIPGTTELQTSEHLPVDKVRRMGSSTFVGGMGGRYDGMACMDFVRDTLEAHKAWFLSSQELIAMGAGISCKQDAKVETTVNQCLLSGTVRVRTKTGIQMLALGDYKILETPCEVEHDNIVYVFPKQTAHIYVTMGSRTGDWFDINKGKVKSSTLHTCNIFMLGIIHGHTPVSANYIYKIMPKATLESVQRNIDKMNVIRNTTACQVVMRRNNTEGISVCQAILYKPCSVKVCENLCFEADKPCLIRLVEKIESEKGCKIVEITLANPAHASLDVIVAINQHLEGKGAKWSETEKTTRLCISLPGGKKAGTSVTKRFKVK